MKSSSFALSIQLHNDQFRTIVDPEREQAVAKSPTDHHIGVSLCIETSVVFREEALVRGN